MPYPRENLIGQTFGRLTVKEFAGAARNRNSLWKCECQCGKISVTEGRNLKSGVSKSCGCLREERRIASITKHGCSKQAGNSSEYNSWLGMRARVYNPNANAYHRYGGRGIKVCPRWDSFDAFLKDMGKKPSARHSLDRRDNDGDYCPENCQWALPHDQSNNRKNNTRITFGGKTLTVTQWAREIGLSPEGMFYRIYDAKWDIERAMTTPVKAA
jgi:hypothetical protein